MNRKAALLLFAGLSAVLGAAAAHLAVSVAFSVAASSQSARMLRVQNFQTPEWMHVASGYLRANASARIVAMGSSFTYGYGLFDDAAYPAVLARLLGEPVLNASIVAASMRGEQFVLCAETIHRRPVILEVPLVNETASFRGHPVPAGLDPCPPWATGTFLGLALGNIRGLAWVAALGDTDARADQGGSVRVGRLPDDYFASADEFHRVEPAIAQRMAQLYDAAAAHADQVYMLVTPVYLPGVSQAGQNAANVEAQFRAVEADCRRLAGPRCISTAGFVDRPDLFSNLTHLNAAGHAALAEAVAAALRQDN